MLHVRAKIESRSLDSMMENVDPNAETMSMEALDGLVQACAEAGRSPEGPAAKQRKREIKTARSKDIGHWKTKAYDACGILKDEGWMANPGDHAGLKARLARAKQLEENFDEKVEMVRK